MSDPLRLLRPLAISATGLAAQRARMDVIAQNIANAETTRTEQGGPYRRKVVTMEPIDGGRPFIERLSGELLRTEPEHFAHGRSFDLSQPTGGGVRLTGVVEDRSPGARVYDPSHPDADAEGYVRMPNVDLTTEMVDLMQARRFYEANVTAFEAGKQILRASLDL